MTHKELLVHYLKGVDTTGVSFALDHWSTGERLAMIIFTGDASRVNAVIKGMKANGANITRFYAKSKPKSSSRSSSSSKSS